MTTKRKKPFNAMRIASYELDDLNDERWHRKRDKVKAYADQRCQACGRDDCGLQVHHSYYISGARAWEYPDGSLIALCEDCHARVHKIPRIVEVHHTATNDLISSITAVVDFFHRNCEAGKLSADEDYLALRKYEVARAIDARVFIKETRNRVDRLTGSLMERLPALETKPTEPTDQTRSVMARCRHLHQKGRRCRHCLSF